MKKLLVFVFFVSLFASCNSGNKNEAPAKDVTVPVELVQSTIDIGGMDCDMCVKSVEKGVNELTGITSVAVSLNDSNAIVKYDASKVQLAEIEKAIEKRGYKVKGVL
jgi:copper chaperone